MNLFWKTEQNPSIPKLSGLVWKAIQKPASFNSIQPRLLRLGKSSPVFYLFHWEEESKRKKKKEHELIGPSLLWHNNEVVPLDSGQPGHQTFRTHLPGRSAFKAKMTSSNANNQYMCFNTTSQSKNLLEQCPRVCSFKYLWYPWKLFRQNLEKQISTDIILEKKRTKTLYLALQEICFPESS